MEFIKEESEDITIAEVFSLKQEEAEEQTDSYDDSEDYTVGGRKRKYGCSWKKYVNKRRRMMGQRYVGMRGNEEVNMEPRVMGPRCQSVGCIKSSKHQCGTIGEAERENIFKCFWENMNWEEKKTYVRGLVDIIPVQRKRGRDDSRRSSTLLYFLKVDGERRRVCKRLFLSTHGLGECSVLRWVQNTGNTQYTPPQLRCDDGEFMRSFLQELPKGTSCNCMSSASKQYLEPGFQSMSALYKVYHRAAEEKMLKPCSRQMFSEEFKQQNLGLHWPKKAQSHTCCSFKTGNFPDNMLQVHFLKEEELCDMQNSNDTCVKTEIKNSYDDSEDYTVGERKRKKGCSWKKCVNKRKRMMGQRYVGMRGNEEVNMEPRVMGPRCESVGCIKSSKHQCGTIGEAERENIFKCFWENMNWEEKKTYVRGLVDIIPVQRKRSPGDSRRSTTLVYFLNVDGERRRVCKRFFLSTHGLGNGSILSWVQEAGNTLNASPHLRCDDGEFMRSFLQELPKVTSCNCRSSASKQYLEPGFQSMSALYKVYHRAAEEKMLKPCSRQMFSEEFKQQNLGLHWPKKDQSNTFCSFNTGNLPDNKLQIHFLKEEELCDMQNSNDINVKTEIKSEW